MLRILLGDYNFNYLAASYPITGTLFFLLYAIFLFFFIVNLFAIVMFNCFTVVRREISQKHKPFYLMDLLNRVSGRQFNLRNFFDSTRVTWWCNGYGVGLAFDRSRVRFPAVPLPGSDPGQVVHTRVPLSPSSTIWYRPKGGDALRPGR